MVKLITAEKCIDASLTPNKPADELWVKTPVLEESTGWALKTQGLCKGEVCIPIHEKQRDQFSEGDEVNVSALWKYLERPLIKDKRASAWVLGEAADERTRQLESLEAPDFALPDIHGNLHRLSDYRGKKIFLTTWATW